MHRDDLSLTRPLVDVTLDVYEVRRCVQEQRHFHCPLVYVRSQRHTSDLDPPFPRYCCASLLALLPAFTYLFK